MFRKLPLPVPPLDEQQQITDYLDAVGSSERTNEVKLAELKAVKKGLLQDLLTGKVRVNVDEAAGEVREAAEALAE